jgi:hypothetical protein
VLAVLLLLSTAILLIFWPQSRHWSAANRLHRLAAGNDAGLRLDTRRQLDGALSAMRVARREAVALGREGDTAQIEAVRERVASEYSPSPANAPGLRRDLDLDRGPWRARRSASTAKHTPAT